MTTRYATGSVTAKPERYTVIGLPGTGKTTKLLEYIDRFEDKYDLTDSNICFVTFRRSMAEEMLARRFPGLTPKQIRAEAHYWATMHGVCKRLAGETDRMATHKVWAKFCDKHHIPFQEGGEEEDLVRWSRSKGAILANVKSFLVHTLLERSEWWRAPGVEQLTSFDVPSLLTAWDEFKFDYSEPNAYREPDEAGEGGDWLDFDDLLSLVDLGHTSPPCSIMVADEYQDMTPLMHRIFQMWAGREGVKAIVIAGDPTQNIYSFFGSDPRYLEDASSGSEIVTLDRSWRLSETIWGYARQIIPQEEVRDIQCTDKPTHIAEVWPKDIPHFLESNRESNMMLLLRTNHLALRVGYILREVGIPFLGLAGWSEKSINLYNAVTRIRLRQMPYVNEWELLLSSLPSSSLAGSKKKILKELTVLAMTPERRLPQGGQFRLGELGPSYFLSTDVLERIRSRDPLPWTVRSGQMLNVALARSPSPTVPGLVRVSTIHAAKGREADVVFLFDGITSRVQRSMMMSGKGWREEARIFFVGATRPRRALYVVRGFGSLSYPLPSVRDVGGRSHG